jgi:xanthine dehydrogenase accessory factor
MQQQRADWLAYRGITELERVHGPAGIDIGARRPAEIALSVLAEAVAVRNGEGIEPERE